MGRARPLSVVVADLVDRPGERRSIDTTARFDDLRLSSAWVEPDTDVRIDLVVESVLGGRLTVTGSVAAPWVGECRRCLGPVAGDLATEVREVFTDPRTEDASDPDLLPIEGVEIDLEPIADREAVLLSLPLAPLCRPECPGPDPEHVPVAVEGEGPPVAELAVRDARWAALDQLHFDE